MTVSWCIINTRGCLFGVTLVHRMPFEFLILTSYCLLVIYIPGLSIADELEGSAAPWLPISRNLQEKAANFTKFCIGVQLDP